jgi:hypothetical protein
MNCSYRHCRSHIVTQEISRSHAWLSRLAQVEHLEIGIMNPRRSATMTAVLCGMGGVAWFAGFGTENTAAPTLNRLAPFLTADFKLADAPQPTAMGKGDADRQDTAASDEPQSIVESALTNSSEMLPFETPPVQVATASTPNAMRRDTSIEGLNECPVREICIDRYLWALYQRTPKEDTIKAQELRKVMVKKKRKLVAVTKSFTKLVDEDFTWKDPKAAERARMPMMDYAIGA